VDTHPKAGRKNARRAGPQPRVWGNGCAAERTETEKVLATSEVATARPACAKHWKGTSEGQDRRNWRKTDLRGQQQSMGGGYLVPGQTHAPHPG